MFYIQQGVLYLVEPVTLLPVYQKMSKEVGKSLQDTLAYIYFVYTKRGELRDNPFKNFALGERKKEVVQAFKLFGGKLTVAMDIESSNAVAPFIAFYKTMQYTPDDLMAEAHHHKAEEWRQLMLNTDNPVSAKEYGEAADYSMKQYAHYQKLAAMQDDSDSAFDGCPLHLMELPEDKRPHHLKIRGI